MSLRPGDLVRPERLEDDIIRFNLLNNSQISAELRAGSEFGATDVALKVDEPPINSGSRVCRQWRALRDRVSIG